MDVILAIAVSTHLGLQQQYNSIHPHVRIEQSPFVAGAYLNSLDTVSGYLGTTFKPTKNTFIEIGVVSGYPDINVFGRAGIQYNSFNIFIAPAIEDNTIGAVLAIELQYNLGERNVRRRRW